MRAPVPAFEFHLQSLAEEKVPPESWSFFGIGKGLKRFGEEQGSGFGKLCAFGLAYDGI